MPTLRFAALFLLVLGLLAGCGGASTARSNKPASPSSGPSATPAAGAAQSTQTSTTPGSPRSLIAVVVEGSSTTLHLVTLDGRDVARTRVPSFASVTGVGGDMATFVVGDQLKALRPSGAVETLGRLPGYSVGPIAVSPDGQHWMWSTYSTSGSSVSSKVVLSTRGGTDRTVAEQTTTTEPRILLPYRWGSAGPIYQSSAMGLGGYILFGEFTTGPTWRVDPATGQTTALLAGTTCPLADLATDGTIACLQHPDGTVLNVLSPAGHVVQMPLPRPAFTQVGAVSFKPGSKATMLVVGGATSAGAEGGREQYETDVFEVGTRSLQRFGPAGLRPGDGPWTWLSDGSLITYRPAGALGGDPGIYLVAPDGGARKVFASGTPIGVLSA
jgi:hypothetical protein